MNSSFTNDLHLGGLRAFGPLGDFEFNLVTLPQGFKPFTLNGRMMNEHILPAFHFNESLTFLVVKPFDSTNHFSLL
jgi:hypothetical protein